MATEIPYVREMDFKYGEADQVSPLIRRVVAENPGPFTYFGTGTYIVGSGTVAVIDPGPNSDVHLEALLAATADERVSHILITHTHRDHSPLAGPLAEKTGAAVCGFGPVNATADGVSGVQVEEGFDLDLNLDVRLGDGDVTEGDGWTLAAVHTPGHLANHLCYALAEERALFTGDHVMGWSTSVVVPPEGGMADYMASLALLLARDDQIFWPTHGPPVTSPRPLVEAYIAHRHEREDQIMAALGAGPATITELLPTVYADVAEHLHPAASRSMYAHLIRLTAEGLVACDGPPQLDSTYRIV